MADFLLDADERIRIFPSTKYRDCWILGISSFMVLRNALVLSRNEGGDAIYILSNRDTGIAAAFRRYRDNELELYRGIASCHFSWPGLTGGLLESEGYADTPTFTMGNEGDAKTRWLPTAQSNNEAAGIALQNVDAYTRAVSMSEPVFIGLSVAIPINTLDHSVCWYNSGELGVRGPLGQAQYSIRTMVWLDTHQPVFRPWPNAVPNTTLPEQRPYQPSTARDIERWWARSQGWANTIAQHDTVINTRRGESMLLVDIYD